MKTINYIEAIRQAIDEEMSRDPKVWILGEDIGLKGGVFRTTEGLQKKFGPLRVLDTPLTEAMIVGVAAGAALYGHRPIAEIQFSDFIMPAANQIISEVAKITYRSQGDWSCPLVIRAPFGGGIGGGLYHSQSIESIFTGIPGLRVVVPSHPHDAKGLLKSAIRSRDPVLFLEHKKAYRLLKEEVTQEEFLEPIDKAKVKREGTDLTIITYGLCVSMAKTVADKWQKKNNTQIHILDLRTLYPLDKQAIIEASNHTGRVLLVTEDNLEGSILGSVSAIIAENCLFNLDAPVMRLGAPEAPAMPYAPPLEKAFMMNIDKIDAAVAQLLSF